MIPFAKPCFSPEARRAIAEAVDRMLCSGALMMGEWQKRFEAEFAALTGRKYAISLNSCTTGLTIALKHAAVEGGEVLVPAGSFVTDVSAVWFAGGHPVLVDLSPRTLAFDFGDLERRLTPRTKAIVWVHLVGLISPEYKEIAAFARKNGLFLIEDASHAHGATADGRVAGSFGDASCFSFYPTKVLTSGTGGMLVTDDEDLAGYARRMRLFGKDETTGDIVDIGNDWFLDEIRACVGYHQARELESQLARRRAIAARYYTKLANQPGLGLIDVPDRHAPAWYQFPVFLDEHIDRDAVRSALKGQHGVDAKPIYKPIHHEPVFRTLDDGSLEETERVLGCSLCLPLFVEMTDTQVDAAAEALVAEVRARL